MSLLGVPMLLGPVFGPVIGGALVEYVSWHWIFLVNLPIGIVAIMLAVWKLSDGREHVTDGRLDTLGLVLLSGGMVCLLYGLSDASSHGSVAERGVLSWLFAGAAAVAVFVWHSLRSGADAIIDVRLFANRVFASGSVAVFLVAIALFGGLLLMPLYYQTVRLEGPMVAGLLIAPQGLGAMLAMPIAGRITDRVGAGRIVPFGILLALIGTLPFTQVGADTSYAVLSIGLFIRGAGIGATMMPVIASSYSRLSHAAMSRATPTISAIQQIGGSLGSALLVMVLSRQITTQFEDQGIPTGGGGGADQIRDIPPQLHDRIAPLLATGFADAFWVAFALTALIFIPAIFLPRRRQAPDRESTEVPTGS